MTRLFTTLFAPFLLMDAKIENIDISVSDVENGNVAEGGANSKHGSLSTLNMEWDNQGFILFKLRDLFCREI